MADTTVPPGSEAIVSVPVNATGDAPAATVVIPIVTPTPEAGTLPGNGDGEKGEKAMAADPTPAVGIDSVSASLLHLHANNGAQRQADGAGHYAENLRYDYLFQKNRVNFADSVGVRHVEESGSGRTRILDATTGGLQSTQK